MLCLGLGEATSCLSAERVGMGFEDSSVIGTVYRTTGASTPWEADTAGQPSDLIAWTMMPASHPTTGYSAPVCVHTTHRPTLFFGLICTLTPDWLWVSQRYSQSTYLPIISIDSIRDILNPPLPILTHLLLAPTHSSRSSLPYCLCSQAIYINILSSLVYLYSSPQHHWSYVSVTHDWMLLFCSSTHFVHLIPQICEIM